MLNQQSNLCFYELIFDLEEEIELKKYELSIAKMENLGFIDFIEMALELKYKVDILNMNEWFVKKKLLQERLYKTYKQETPIYEVLLIERTIDFFKDFFDRYLANFTDVCGQIQIVNIIGRRIYLGIPITNQQHNDYSGGI